MNAIAEARPERVRVMMGLNWPEEKMQRVRAVDPRLEIVDVSPGWYAFLTRRRGLSQEQQEALDTFYEELSQADVLINRSAPRDVVARGPRLKWVHILSHGLDHLRGHPLLESSLLLTSSGGTDGPRLAEGAMGILFMLAANARRLVEQQQRHVWRPFDKFTLRGKTLAVLGYGNIGKAAAVMAGACGMRVIAMRRSLTERTAGDGVAEMLYPPSELPVFLAEADVLLISTPLTPSTEKLIGRQELAIMKPTALLVNVARGAIVDEDALVEALAAGTIGGAGLDAFSTEPLPPDSPLWELPNVVIWPHMTGRSDDPGDEGLDLVVTNLRHYLNGEPLEEQIDRTGGLF